MERIVISLGGNAFTRPGEPLTMAKQFSFAKSTLAPLTRILKADTELIITHGNGPQVGYILTRVEKALGSAYSLPLEVCVAESEGELGYVLQQTLANLFRDRHVVTLLTQVRVDPKDSSFSHPTKPIGPYLNEEAAARLRDNGLDVSEKSDLGYRRIVPSPLPQEIIEIEVIRSLMASKTIVIAGGGGGIPVVDSSEGLQGVEAVVDKDFVTVMLARELSADKVIMVTGVEGVYTDFETPEAKLIKRISPEDLKVLASDNHFPPGSMGPKVTAAIQFTSETGKPAVICQPDDLAEAVNLNAGTLIMSGKR